MTWAARARKIIGELLAELPADASLEARRRALRGQCPWEQSIPRKAWLQEVRRILKIEPQGAARRRAAREEAAGQLSLEPHFLRAAVAAQLGARCRCGRGVSRSGDTCAGCRSREAI